MTTRRAFLGTLAGGLLAAPLAAEAQQAAKVYRLARIMREKAPTLTPALSLAEGEGATSIPSPPEGERVRVRGSAGRGNGVHE